MEKSYYGIEGQAPARNNALAIVTVRNARFWRGLQEFCFEPRGDSVLVTGLWDNAVAFSTLLPTDEARARYKWAASKGVRTK